MGRTQWAGRREAQTDGEAQSKTGELASKKSTEGISGREGMRARHWLQQLPYSIPSKTLFFSHLDTMYHKTDGISLLIGDGLLPFLSGI